MKAFKNQLTEEKWVLLAVFLVFTLTYFTRLVWSIYFIFSAFDQYQESYRFFIATQLLPLLWDVLPIGLLVYFHIRNFTPKKTKDMKIQPEEAKLANSASTLDNTHYSIASESCDESDISEE